MTVPVIYPGSPLAHVIFQIRHPRSAAMGGVLAEQAKDALGSLLPLRSDEAVIDAFSGPTGDDPVPEAFPRFMSRSRDAAVDFRRRLTTIELSRYPGYQEFRSLIGLVLRVREALTPLDGIERVGIRYLNEIRVPEVSDWTQWIAPELLGPSRLSLSKEWTTDTWQGLVRWKSHPQRELTIRYGSAVGMAVRSDALVRPTEAQGKFFLLDMDSSWSPEVVPEFQLESLLEVCDDLHSPIRAAFEAAVTERYRKEVLTK